MRQGASPTSVKDTPRRGAAGVPGLGRITGQRIVLGADGAECTVFGRRHRRPVEQRVPLSVAAELARRGVATVVRVVEA